MSWIKFSLLLLCLLISAPAVAHSKCIDIRTADFNNRLYPLNESGFTKHKQLLRVSKGRYEDQSDSTSLAFLYFQITDLVFGDLTGDGKDEAAIVATYGSNSGSFFLTDIYIFGCVSGKVKLIDILKQSRIERESGMLVHESIKKSAKIRNRVLSIAYGTEGSRPAPEFTTTFRYKIRRGHLAAYKRPFKRNNL